MKTRVAVLGTVADLHAAGIAYDLETLTRLADDLAPDLLCAQVPRDAWERGESGGFEVEYREALVPLAKVSDIVIVPVMTPSPEPPAVGWRRWLIGVVDRAFRWAVRTASSPEIINAGWFSHVCAVLCELHIRLGGALVRAWWEASNRVVLENLQAAIARDPAARVLVTVDCRRKHGLERELRRIAGVDVVPYHAL